MIAGYALVSVRVFAVPGPDYIVIQYIGRNVHIIQLSHDLKRQREAIRIKNIVCVFEIYAKFRVALNHRPVGIIPGGRGSRTGFSAAPLTAAIPYVGYFVNSGFFVQISSIVRGSGRPLSAVHYFGYRLALVVYAYNILDYQATRVNVVLALDYRQIQGSQKFR